MRSSVVDPVDQVGERARREHEGRRVGARPTCMLDRSPGPARPRRRPGSPARCALRAGRRRPPRAARPAGRWARRTAACAASRAWPVSRSSRRMTRPPPRTLRRPMPRPARIAATATRDRRREQPSSVFATPAIVRHPPLRARQPTGRAGVRQPGVRARIAQNAANATKLQRLRYTLGRCLQHARAIRTMIEIRRNDIETECAVCGRTLLLGERLVDLPPALEEDARVCELCLDEADARGWIARRRAGRAAAAVERLRQRGLRGVPGSRRKRHRRRPAPLDPEALPGRPARRRRGRRSSCSTSRPTRAPCPASPARSASRA